MHPDDLVASLIERLLEQQAVLQRIAAALERSARANDDAAGVVASMLPQIHTALAGNRDELAGLKALLPAIQAASVEGGKAAAVLADNFKDVQDDIREATNKFLRLAPDDAPDTDKTIGKTVRVGFVVLRRAAPWVASSGIGAAIIHLLHVLHIL